MTTFEFGLNLIAAHLRNYDDPNIVSISGRFLDEKGRQYFRLVDEIPPETAKKPYGWLQFRDVELPGPRLPMQTTNFRFAVGSPGGRRI